MASKTVPKEWKKIIGRKATKIRKASSKNGEWVFEMLGWKKDARRPN